MRTTAERAGELVLAGRHLTLLDRARVYTCGITPYDVTHLGHAATFVWVDLLTRVLRDRGVTPVTCRNITDVDDVLSAAAERAGSYYDRFAYLQQYDFDRDMVALSVRRPDHEPRARHHIGQVQRLAGALLDLDRAYVAAGSVYFPGADVAAAHGLDEATALELAREYGGRVDDPGKRHPLDTAIWQRSEPGQPSWDSPWGPGRPGWHAGCTAMAVSALGASVDIHCGGADLRFPHHAVEAAMAERVTGVTPFARAWMHVGVVGVHGQKMAKSTGNLVLVSELLAEQPAAAVRLMLLNRAWAESWDYHPAELLDAAALLTELRRGGDGPGDPAGVAAVRACLAHDLDVPAAVTVAREHGGDAARHLLGVLGLGEAAPI